MVSKTQRYNVTRHDRRFLIIYRNVSGENNGNMTAVRTHFFRPNVTETRYNNSGTKKKKKSEE